MEAAFFNPRVAGVRKQSLGPGTAVPDPTVRDLCWAHSCPWSLLDSVQAESLSLSPSPLPGIWPQDRHWPH